MKIAKSRKKAGIAAVAVLSVASIGTAGMTVGSEAQQSGQGDAGVVEGKYFCNVKALTAAERGRHAQLTEKLLAKRQETVETEKGYEFQYSPADIMVGEVAEWVVAESKCCPFFDFHIDLEKEGKLLCLRLTGNAGVKQFIRAEFGLK